MGIEEITEEVESASSESGKRPALDTSVTHAEEISRHVVGQAETIDKRRTTESECLQALKDDPDTIRQVFSFEPPQGWGTLFFSFPFIFILEGRS